MMYAILLAQQQAQPEGPPGWTALVLPVGLMVLFYFVMIRPMQRQERDRKDMVSTLKKNARVVTSSGIIGNILRIKEDDEVVLLELEQGKMEVLKSSILRAIQEGKSGEGDDKPEGTKES